MKKLLLLFVLLISLNAKGQYVTLADTNLSNYIKLLIPTCFNGNQMDTTCSGVLTLQLLNCDYRNVHDLTGIEYFKGLNKLTCTNNQITTLDRLPAHIKEIICDHNPITNIVSLPDSLTWLDANYLNLGYLPPLPNTLKMLSARYSVLYALPALPDSLEKLLCTANSITAIPNIPPKVIEFACDSNQLTSIPALPNTMKYFTCSKNNIMALPTLPDSLLLLDCSYNLITNLNSLPNNLQALICHVDSLTSLPLLPNSITVLSCGMNKLTSLPNLPPNIISLECTNNQISCFPVFPQTLNNGEIYIDQNPFTCLPNYLSIMSWNGSGLISYPLCNANDPANNPHGCDASVGILGYTYKDLNNNCSKNSNDPGFGNVPIKLFATAGNLLGQTVSGSNGVYDFTSIVGTFKITIDTVGKPYTVICGSGVDSTVTNTNANPLSSNVNFAVTCKSSFDVGVKAVNYFGTPFPGEQHTLSVLAGDLSQWIGLNCAAGASGQIQINITGPAVFVGIPSGAIVPIANGNNFTYNISDFGNQNLFDALQIDLTIDTTAQAGDMVCATITVSPGTDNNPANNLYTYCYQVINSLDPNYKSVYPTNVSPLYNDWFTYTIHFQNTGNAAAHNIRLLDTLSNNLDLNTFEVINYSHYNKVYLNGNILTVTYPNIMLPDSLSDPVGSQGFVQYRIKSKQGMQLGTQIKNTAYIYFDYNSPVVTNTAVSEFTTTSIKNIKANQLQVFPNPTTGKLTIKSNSNKASINLYNQLGERLIQMNNVSQQTEIDLANFPAGMYYLQLRTGGGVETVKVEKE